jgi:hypothetical protein
MTNSVDPGDPSVTEAALAGVGVPPPMPSIAGSALLESRRLIDLTRRMLAAWLAPD